MELFQAHDHYIIQDGEHSLWCNRFDGRLSPRSGSDLCTAWNPVCLGQVEGVIGKLQIHPDSDWKLLLIRQRTHVGCLPDGSDVYSINKIAVLPLTLNEPTDLEIELCKKHHFGMTKPDKIVTSQDGQQKALIKTWNSIKSVTTGTKGKKKELKDREKLERRVLEELHKMFSDYDSFYYSPTGDLTNSIQRQHLHKDKDSSFKLNPDDRFFWNKFMIQDIIDCEDAALSDHWRVPVIQGFVQIEKCQLDFSEDEEADDPMLQEPLQFTLSLISRRSRHRAGTRYKRRGVDEKGACANYVETEQILSIPHHTVAFVQVRGSVPVFWSQPGYKYRPPPRLDKGEEDTDNAFRRHFDGELNIYKKVAIINLVDQTGREQIIGDAFVHYILNYNSPLLTYVSFDFHEYCRGMKFENVSVLTESIKEIIKDMRYCWVDRKGIICDQRNVFRVNCMDCLDRTNVVQTAIARVVLDTQLRKLGMLVPDSMMTPGVRTAYQQMWANNGDAISRQYAGTAALKGDFTRTGERRFSGVMKDGYNSANRYIQNRFKDAYRQVAIDLMLGNPVTEDLSLLNATKSPENEEDVWILEKEDSVNQLIQHCKKLLLPQNEECFGGWALIDCDPPENTDVMLQDMDVILLLTQRAYYIASHMSIMYDDDAEKVTHYQRIPIDDLEMVEIGPEPSLFKSKFTCLRIHHCYGSEVGYFHTLRALPSKADSEARVIFHTIVEAFATSRAANSLGLKVVDGKLERRKSKPPEEVISISSQTRLSAWIKENLTREMVQKKPVPPPRSHRSGASTFTPRVSRAGDQAKAYIKNVKTKISSFNPIRKVKLKRSAGGSTSMRHQKGVLPQDSTESKDSTEMEAFSLPPSSSSSDNEDYGVLIDGNDVADDVVCNLSEHSNDDDLRDFVDKEVDTDDSDIVLPSCGIIAARKSSFNNSLQEIDFLSCDELSDEIRRKLHEKAMQRLERTISVSHEGRDLAETINFELLEEEAYVKEQKKGVNFTVDSDEDEQGEIKLLGASSIKFSISTEPLIPNGRDFCQHDSSDEILEDIIDDVLTDDSVDDSLTRTLGCGTAQCVNGDVNYNGGKAEQVTNESLSITSSTAQTVSSESSSQQLNVLSMASIEPPRSPVKSQSENCLTDYAISVSSPGRSDTKPPYSGAAEIESNNSSIASSPTASPMSRIREHITSINLPLMRRGSRRQRQVKSMVSLEMRLRSKNCLTQFIQL
ncbi:phosphatidylinositide phosphatase SAC2-like [Saccoglossus kowalevskii]